MTEWPILSFTDPIYVEEIPQRDAFRHGSTQNLRHQKKNRRLEEKIKDERRTDKGESKVRNWKNTDMTSKKKSQYSGWWVGPNLRCRRINEDIH